MPEHEIRIDIDPLVEEYMREEPDVHDDDAIIQRCLDGMPTGKVAQHTIVARELKNAPEDILPPNLDLMLSGGRVAVTAKFASLKQERETKDGRRYTVREFVSLWGVEPSPMVEGEQVNDEIVTGIIKSSDKRAAYMAEDYLLEKIPAHVAGRFAILYELNEDVRGVGEELIKRIRELIEKYSD